MQKQRIGVTRGRESSERRPVRVAPAASGSTGRRGRRPRGPRPSPAPASAWTAGSPRCSARSERSGSVSSMRSTNTPPVARRTPSCRWRCVRRRCAGRRWGSGRNVLSLSGRGLFPLLPVGVFSCKQVESITPPWYACGHEPASRPAARATGGPSAARPARDALPRRRHALPHHRLHAVPHAGPQTRPGRARRDARVLRRHLPPGRRPHGRRRGRHARVDRPGPPGRGGSRPKRGAPTAAASSSTARPAACTPCCSRCAAPATR